MKSLTFITGNAHKAVQLSRYLSFSVKHAKLDIPEIQSLDLEEASTKKAKAAYAILETPVLVENTALTFEALNGLPGTLVKWFLSQSGMRVYAKYYSGTITEQLLLKLAMLYVMKQECIYLRVLEKEEYLTFQEVRLISAGIQFLFLKGQS